MTKIYELEAFDGNSQRVRGLFRQTPDYEYAKSLAELTLIEHGTVSRVEVWQHHTGIFGERWKKVFETRIPWH